MNFAARHKHSLLLFVVILLATFCFFGNTIGNDWTYDDFPVIVENPDVKSWTGFFENSYPSRPLRELTYLLDHALFGLDPAGFHVQSIAWHGLAGFLIALLIFKLNFGWWTGLCSGLLFLAHPITVEAVANVSHRKESLALVFSLLAIFTYRQACVATKARWLWVVASLGLIVVAFLGKQTAVGMPLVLLAYEWCFVDKDRWLALRFWPQLSTIGSLLALSGIGWFVFSDGVEAYARLMKGILQFKANYFEPVDFFVFLQTLLKSWAFSFSKLLLPVNLSAEYTFPVPGGWFDIWVLCGLVLVVLSAFLLIYTAKTHNAAFFWLIMAVVFFLPVSNLWPKVYLAADRYLYVPWAALAMLIGWVLRSFLNKPRAAIVFSVLIVLPLACLSWQQNQVWASPEKLWMHALEVNPESSFVLNNVGNLHLLRNDFDGAVSYYQKTIEINPLNPTAWFNLGYIHEQQGRIPFALKYYQQFINVADDQWQKDVERLQQHLYLRYRTQIKREPFNPSLSLP